MDELTITLTGKKSEEYLTLKENYTKLLSKFEDAVSIVKTATDRYEAEVDKNLDLVKQINTLKSSQNKEYVPIKELIEKNSKLTKENKELLEQLDNLTNSNKTDSENVENFVWENPPLPGLLDNTEKDTTSTEVIESNPIAFPTNTSKPKSGTLWTKEELDVIKRSLDSNYTLSFLKVKLSNRSESAIRSMLLNYGVGVKNNKLYAK